MSDTTTIALTVGVIVIALGVIAVFVIADIRARADDPPLVHAGLHTPRRSGRHRARELPPMWVHAAPRNRFTPEQAHTQMQLHIDCLIQECPRKLAAYNVLVDAGKLTPRQPRVRA